MRCPDHRATRYNRQEPYSESCLGNKERYIEREREREREREGEREREV
jgi:hypothetical protein